MAILNMERFGTEMAYFRFMLNSDISLITLFIIYYNVTKKHRGNGGRLRWEWRPDWELNDAGMRDTGAGTLQAGAVWNLPSPFTSNVWRISARPMPWRVLQRQNRLLRANLRGIADKRFFLFRIADLHIPAKFRLAKSSPSVNFRGRTRHYTFSLHCSSLTFNNFQNHKNVRRTEISLKGQTS